VAKRRIPEMTLEGWLALAGSLAVHERIASEQGLNDFQAVVRVVNRRSELDWDEAIGALHMVYAWMPTMLRPTVGHSEQQRKRLLTTLNSAKEGKLLDGAQLDWVKQFSNRSVVGASKLLHALNPDNYVIWDSRVAEVFLWKGVTPATYSTVDRYIEYLISMHQWVKVPEVIAKCDVLRKVNTALADAGDLRMIELVLFRGIK
jgi:hypothetical protein